MARAYTLNIAADTRAVKVGIDKGVIEPLEDALEVLEDIGSDGGRDLDKLEDAARDAQDQTEKVKREFSDLAKEIRETGRKAKTDFGDKVKDATDTASEGMEEFKDEGTGTAKEIAASFDGSMESIAGGIQEVAANAFAGFGPAGAAAGIAAALGLGVVLEEFTKQQEAADELKERITSAYRTAIEEGRAHLTEAQIIEAGLDIIQSDRREKLVEEAKKIGVEFNTIVRAEAGDYEALQEVIAAAEQAQTERFDAGKREAGDRSAQIDTEIGAIGGIIRRLEDEKKTHDEAKAAASAYADFVKASEREVIDSTKRQTAGVALIKDEYNAIPRNVKTTVTAQVDTGSADRAIRNFIQTPRRLRIDIEGRTANGQRVI